MKKLLLIFALIATLISCSNQPRKVHAYRQYDSNLDTWVYWYLLQRPNNTYYYYHSNTPVSSFRNVSWSTTNSGFNKTTAQTQPYVYVESQDFSTEMNREFQQYDNFYPQEKPNYKYNESDDFKTGSNTTSEDNKSKYKYDQSDDFDSDWGSSSSDNNSHDYQQSDDFNSGSNDYNSSESNDFGGSQNSNDNSGNYESNESNDFD